MRNLFILILTLFTISCSSQTTPTGFTRYYSNVAYNGIWPMIYGAAPLGDTMVTVKGKGQMVQDSLTGTVWHVVSLTGKKWEPMGGGAGTGVTSVGMSATGALGVTPSLITSSGTFALAWQGTNAQYVRGDGSLSSFSNDVETYGDAHYSPLGHTHTFSQITDGPTAVRNLFSATAPLNYNSSTGVFSISGGAVADGLQSGGVVTWSGTGLVFDVTAATYVIGGATYTSSGAQVTLDPADASYGRYDAIIVTNTGAVSKITGSPSASPVFPQIDPASEILLTYVFIDAGATTPTQVTNEVIYDENVEWSHSTSGSVTANFASTTFAEQGTKSIQTTWTSTSNLIFTNGSTLSSGNYTTISFYVKLTNNLANNTNISLQFYNGANAVSNSITATIQKTGNTSWQLVSYNVPQFTFTSNSFNSVKLILTGSTMGLLNSATVFFDNLRLQAGITPPTTVQGLQSAYSRVTDGTTIAAATGSDQLRFRSADNKLSIAVANNDATYGDNVLFTINQGNLSLSSIGGSLNVSQINASGTASSSTVLHGDGTWGAAGGSSGIDDVLSVGQSLTADRTINTSSHKLIITGTSSSRTVEIANTNNQNALYVTATNNPAIQAISTGGVGVYGQTTDYYGVYAAATTTGYALQASAQSGYGVYSQSASGVAGLFRSDDNSTSTVKSILELYRNSGGGAGANGMGGSIDFTTINSSSSKITANQIVSKLTDATALSETSTMEIWGRNGGTTGKVIGIPSVIGNYANNAAAITAGLSAGDIYRNGDALMIVH